MKYMKMPSFCFYFCTVVSLFFCTKEILAQSKSRRKDHVIRSLDNSIFKRDVYWSGGDGASSIDLGNGRILWLFSDSFINSTGSGSRSDATIIKNSIAIQYGYDIIEDSISFHYGGTSKDPLPFFQCEGETWFWTGHGTLRDGKLLIFLFEVESSSEGIGFQAKSWHLALIKNPNDSPENWQIDIHHGVSPEMILIGSSAVLQDENYIYAYGVHEPKTHNVYLVRFPVQDILNGILTSMEWWSGNGWAKNEGIIPNKGILFEGQTEFSVTWEPSVKKYLQVQTYGFGKADLGYRLSNDPQGPWSDPVMFYKPHYHDDHQIGYSAKTHPEMDSDGIVITFNINNLDFQKLLEDKTIYYPRILILNFP